MKKTIISSIFTLIACAASAQFYSFDGTSSTAEWKDKANWTLNGEPVSEAPNPPDTDTFEFDITSETDTATIIVNRAYKLNASTTRTNKIYTSGNIKTLNIIASATGNGSMNDIDISNLDDITINASANSANKMRILGVINENVVLNYGAGLLAPHSKYWLNSSSFKGTINFQTNIEFSRIMDSVDSTTKTSKAGLHVSNNSTLKVTGASTFGSSGSATLLRDGSNMFIEKGSTIDITSGLRMADGVIEGDLYVRGAQVFTAANSATDNDVALMITGKTVFKETANLTQLYADSTQARVLAQNTTAQIYSYAQKGALKIAQALQLSKGATLVLNSQDAFDSQGTGKLNLLVSQYTFAQGGTVDGTAIANLAIGVDADTGAKLSVEKNTIGNLTMYNDSTLNILLNGNELVIEKLISDGTTSDFTLVLQDEIIKGSLFIGDFNSLISADDVKSHLSSNLGSEIFVEFANGTSADGGYYIYTSVPEPAQWAMIFGAIALGFVAFRRRK